MSKKFILQCGMAIAASASMLVASGAAAQSAGEIRLGVLATLQGAFAVLGQDGMRGVQIALDDANGAVAGKKLSILVGSTDATPNTAVAVARKLVEQDKVDLIIGPLSGGEGLAVKAYARGRPETTFIYGSAAQDVTLRDPVPNYFRFSGDGAQWMAGLGNYVYDSKKYRRVAVLAEDYSYAYSQVQGFMTEFCSRGGKVTKKFWVPIGTKDFSSVVTAVPKDVDAIYVGLSGADAVNFLTQYRQAGGDKPMIGGSLLVDQSVLSSKGRFKDHVIGTPAAGPIADSLDEPKWQAFVAKYRARFKDGFSSPSLIAYAYYVNTSAAIAGLDAVKGDLGGGQAKLRDALAKLQLDTPTGVVRLDKNRQASIDNFVTEVAVNTSGELYNKVVGRVANVNQTLGMDPAMFMRAGPASRDNPDCP